MRDFMESKKRIMQQHDSLWWNFKTLASAKNSVIILSDFSEE